MTIPRWRFKCYFEPRDIWIGVYWNKICDPDGKAIGCDIYVCLVPMLPLKFSYF